LGKRPYPTERYEAARDKIIYWLTHDIVEEGRIICEQGYKLIQSTEEMMVSGRELSKQEKEELCGTLEEGMGLIQQGMSLFDEAYKVSGTIPDGVDTKKYGKARTAARYKVLELKE
ncbi:MAG: hypothetical protein ACYTAF_04425, partial [Planctomycetota bacterium]